VTTTKKDEQEEQGHVHGPGCQHDHHHHHAQAPFVRAQPKVGRNDPCPCGSGSKFKKCCGRNA
jgi:uncharacterized protein YecA (UPF0149 family)